jgi:hypothetical protein
LVCKTEADVQALFKFGDENDQASLPDAIAAVNAKAPSPACGLMDIYLERGEVISSALHKAQEFDITKISIKGVCANGMCVCAEPEDAIAVFPHGIDA